MPSAVKESRCRLLELPTEIQSLIWHELVLQTRIVSLLGEQLRWYSLLNNEDDRVRFNRDGLAVKYVASLKSALLACRAVRTALQPILARHTILEISGRLPMLDSIPVEVQRIYVPQIRHVKFELYRVQESPAFDPLQFPRLENLELSILRDHSAPQDLVPTPDLHSKIGAASKSQLWDQLSGSQDKGFIIEWLQSVHERREDCSPWLCRELMPTRGRHHKVLVTRPWPLTAYKMPPPYGRVGVILELTFDVDTRQVHHRNLVYQEFWKRYLNRPITLIDTEEDLIFGHAQETDYDEHS